jgi:alpha-1,2-mannosyltransferase
VSRVTRASWVELLESRLARVGSVVLWMVCVTIMLFGALHKAHRPNGNDLTLYLDTAQGLLAGRHPYGIPAMFAYAYPLFLAAVLAPLAALPRDLAIVLWFVGCVAALACAARVMVDLARERDIVRGGIPLTVPLVVLWFLFLDPIQSDLLNGQANFPVLLLCVLCLRALFRGRTLSMAASLATAVAVKITPALLLGFLAVRRRWGAIALCLGLAALLVLAPLVLVGQGLAPYRAYLDSFILARVRGEFLTPQGVRFSVNGVLERLAPEWGAAPWRRVLGGSLPLIGLALIELLARPRRGRGRDVWVFCLYLLALPLATPMSEVHHLTYAFPALGLLLLAAALGDPRSRLPLRLGGGLACWLLLLGGRLDRAGPWFFLGLCLLAGLVAAEALARPGAGDVDTRAVDQRPRAGGR